VRAVLFTRVLYHSVSPRAHHVGGEALQVGVIPHTNTHCECRSLVFSLVCFRGRGPDLWSDCPAAAAPMGVLPRPASMSLRNGYVSGYRCSSSPVCALMLHAAVVQECTPETCSNWSACENSHMTRGTCTYKDTTEVFETDGRGEGVRATRDIRAGSFIMEFTGRKTVSRFSLHARGCMGEGNRPDSDALPRSNR
jgi:hypothetical protein